MIVVVILIFSTAVIKYSLSRNANPSVRRIKLRMSEPDSIDPLQQIKMTSRLSQPSRLRKSNSNQIDTTRGNVTLGDGGAKNVESLKEKLRRYEVEHLKILPFEFLTAFKKFSYKAVPRLALVMLTVHAMLLIPSLYILKLSLDMPIIPVIYLGPFIFLTPYLVFGAWENGIAKGEYVTSVLRNFVRGRKELAVELMTKGESKSRLTHLESLTPNASDLEREQLEDLFRDYAFISMVSKIDPGLLVDDILLLKRRLLKASNLLESLSASGESQSMLYLERTGLYLDDDSTYDSSSLQQLQCSEDISKAALAVLKAAAATPETSGMDDEALLKELKSLQTTYNSGSESNADEVDGLLGLVLRRMGLRKPVMRNE